MKFILLYSIIMFLAVWLYERKKRQTDDHFLVANRAVGGFFGSMSIAASWIWAPALFVSSQVGYQWGYSGLCWFVVPNILALMLFAPLAARVRKVIPNGYSYIEYIRFSSSGFCSTQLSVQLGVQVISFAVQVTAGAELLSMVSGADYQQVVLVMTIAPLTYSLLSGLSSSIFTDSLQYLLIAGSILLIFLRVPLWGEVSVQEVPSFEPFDPEMLLQFGLASGLALIFGIFADHQQWQRAFAIEQDKVFRTYLGAGVLHGIITLSLGTLGVLLALTGFETGSPQLVVADYIQQDMPSLFSIVFTVMALCGLCSTLDSCFCAFGSLVCTEILPRRSRLPSARMAMVLLALSGLLVGSCRVPVITLWLMVGVLRLTSVAPTLWSIFGKEFSGKVGTCAVIFSALIGTPFFVYGSLADKNTLRTGGMLLCILASTLCCVAGHLARSEVKSKRGFLFVRGNGL